MEQVVPKAMAGDIPVYCAHDDLVDITKLVGNPKNPNKHSKEQIKLLARIIQSQGWRSPITVSKRSGFIVKGHGRLAAAVAMKTETAPVDYQDYDSEAAEWADLVADAEFKKFLLAFYKNTYAVMADAACIYVFHADKETVNFRTAFTEAGFFCHETCLWVKNSFAMGKCDYHYQHEPVLYGWKPGGSHKWYSDRKQSTVWNYDRPKKNEVHPTMKPLQLIAYPIINSSMVNSIVLDPFGGSGSTLIACEQTDRICCMIELDERYTDVIVKRFIDQAGGDGDVYLIRDGLKITTAISQKKVRIMVDLTLGSLFDGSGGFPLGAILNGITPVWASEIEPFPIRVTTKRIPQMKHYGDICKINGGEIEPVDIISFGSPCTDLSLAGRRIGIGGSKSSLFFEAIRVIKEMRCKTNGRYPRFIIWENVFGAFSSGKSRDFRTVLEEIVRIKDETISVPMLQRTNGLQQEKLWETVFPSHSEPWTRNFGESPSVAAVSTLSQILEADVPEKYYLSPKACLGILRRAQARGKELPPMLKAALERQ